MPAKIGLGEHFRKLATFSGREDRSSFWPYAALVLAIVLVAQSLMALPMMAHLMQVEPELGAPDPADATFSTGLEFPVSMQGPIAGPVLPVGDLAAYLGVTLGLVILLYAAAVVRRLHDRGRSGAWGLMPLPFLACTLVGAIGLVDSINREGEPDMTLFFTVALSNIVSWAALIALVVLLAGASDPQPNRYDAEG